MISDYLIPKLKETFPDRSFVQNSHPTKPVVTYSAAHHEVGDLNIYDDGEEARVEISKITHGHYGCWDENLKEAERQKDIAESVVDFVKQIFDERVIFFSSLNGRVGGWQMLKADGTRHEKRPLTKYYSWSGPLND